VRQIANLILTSNNPIGEAVLQDDNEITDVLGKNWVPGFLSRNPRIATVRGNVIERARVDGATSEKLRIFFDLLHQQTKVKKIRPEDVYNMDETGLAMGLGQITSWLA